MYIMMLHVLLYMCMYIIYDVTCSVIFVNVYYDVTCYVIYMYVYYDVTCYVI